MTNAATAMGLPGFLRALADTNRAGIADLPFEQWRTVERFSPLVERGPPQRENSFVLFRHAVTVFHPVVRYCDAEGREMTLRFAGDRATVRHGLVRFRLMKREDGQGARLVEEAGL